MYLHQRLAGEFLGSPFTGNIHPMKDWQSTFRMSKPLSLQKLLICSVEFDNMWKGTSK